ncbi:MAG TPA: four helix bundle protein [Armatimonadota bacterium]|jgi:four helix bundle protein
MPVRNYADLDVWQVSMEFVEACYAVTRAMPADERYGLCSPLRRAAVSVPANIAEGHARRRTREYLHHLDIAYGSLAETETHLRIAERLHFVTPVETGAAIELAARVGQMLNRLIGSLCPEAQDE